MEVLAKRAITLKVSGVLRSPFVPMLLATYKVVSSLGAGQCDREGCWGEKGDKVVVGKDGGKEKKTEYFYGYKDQVSLNAEAEMITSFKAGCGDEYDEQ
jgi:hypothetical protein